MTAKQVNIISISLLSVFVSVILILFGNFIIFNLFYIFVFFFIVLKKILKGDNLKTQIFAGSIFAGIMVMELIFNIFIMFDPINNDYQFFSKILGTIMVFIPFGVERLIIVSKYDSCDFPAVMDLNTVSYHDYLANADIIGKRIDTLKREKEKITYDDIMEILKDLPKHNSFKYINKDSLSDDYFKKAYDTVDDEHIYIILSNTGSAASKVISTFTNKIYNHVSISFDSELETIISYNGGEHLYPPGLNPELIDWFNKKEDSSVIVYKLDISSDNKYLLINKVADINKAGNAYNILGLILKLSVKPNILFCSQFIYKLLEIAELNYFKKDDGQVKPTDFVELDYYRKLEFAYEIKFNSERE